MRGQHSAVQPARRAIVLDVQRAGLEGLGEDDRVDRRVAVGPELEEHVALVDTLLTLRRAEQITGRPGTDLVGAVALVLRQVERGTKPAITDRERLGRPN